MHSTLTPDGGPLYTETDFTQLIREPYNAMTAILYLFLAIYWLIQIRNNKNLKNRFLMFALPVLAIGGIGGTLFHALRTHWLFLMLDVMPILILSVFVSLMYWKKSLKHRSGPFLVVAGFFLIQQGIFKFVPRPYSINLSYLWMAIFVAAPLILYFYKNNKKLLPKVFLSFGIFSLALFFRSYDLYSKEIFPMGTHWLWHLVALFAIHFLIQIVAIDSQRSSKAL